MRIIILANSDLGLYKFRSELVEELVKDHELYICLPDGRYVKNLVDMGAKYVACESLNRRGTNPLQDISLYKFYLKTLKDIKPGIVFTYTIKPNVYGGIACQKLGIPYVVNVTGLGSAVENGGLLQLITVNLYKMGIKGAQKVFFQNKENRDFMVEKHAVGKSYEMLPGSGVNLNKYKPTEYPTGDINFLFVARVMKEKGIDQYLDAAKAITAKYEYVHFHVCGPCEEEYEDILKELQDKNVIIYHGQVDDMEKMYEMASATIHPTYYPEGLSNVLLETCASGRPIITTNRSGCREVIDDGENGYIVKEKDSADLIEKIEKFINLSSDERKQLGLNARAKVERQFDRQIAINSYLGEIKKVL